MKNSKGFTLIELIIVLVIGTMILGIVYTIYFTGIKAYEGTSDSFEYQSSVRNAIEITNSSIRFSTVGFAVTKDDYDPVITMSDDGKTIVGVTGLVKPWEYIGLSPDRTKLLHYVYVKSTDSYKVETLLNETEGLTFDLKLNKMDFSASDKMIHYDLRVFKEGIEKTHFSTEVEALNALQIFDWGDKTNPAIALAFRTEETPRVDELPVGAISVVLDTSGSMLWGLKGNGTAVTSVDGANPQRLSLLKNTLTDPNFGLLNLLEGTDSFVSLVPFSDNANMPHSNYSGIWGIDTQKFYNVSQPSDRVPLEELINSLSANGATNTGDGMRRGFGQLLDFESNKDDYGITDKQEIKSFMIVLIDGVTTAASANIKVKTYWNFGSGYRYEGAFSSFVELPDVDVGDDLFTSRTPDYGYYTHQLVPYVDGGSSWISPIGDGSVLDEPYGETYVRKIGNWIQNSKKVDQCFVIGYSDYIEGGVYTELESVANVAKSLGITVGAGEASEQFIHNDHVFIATDKESLANAFEDIGNSISEGIWQIVGPKVR